MGSDITKYTGFDLDMLDQVDQQVDAVSGNVYLTVDVGDTVVRFLPARAGKAPFRVTSMHYIDAIPGLEKMIVFACPRVELKQACPACQEADRLLATRNPIDRERAMRISGTLRVYANVLDRNAAASGPKIFSMGIMIWKKLKSLRANPRLGGDFTDPSAAGFDVIITREGTGPRDTRYEVYPDRNNSPLAATQEEVEEILARQHDLDLQVDPTVPEELAGAWRSLATAGAGGARKPAPARRSAAQDAKVTDVPGEEVDSDDPANWK